MRASERLVEEFKRKFNKLRREYPNKVRKKIILVIYTSFVLPDLIGRAKRENIWVLKATEDIVKPAS